MDKRPPQKAFRLSEEDQDILEALSRHLGVNQTSVIKLALRDKAKAEGVSIRERDREAVAA